MSESDFELMAASADYMSHPWTFVIPDMHGRPDALRLLLTDAGLIDADGKRKAERPKYQTTIVSIGDLLNATQTDVNGDEEILQLSRDWIDVLVLGNHEAPYIFGESWGFSGYYDAPHLSSAYRALYREGKVVPSFLVGKTLLTHAGVHKYFDFDDAEEAHHEITDVWNRWSELNHNDWPESWNFPSGVEMPKSQILEAVGSKRGGNMPFGGILWADFHEPKNKQFSQLFGHTPIKTGPVVTAWKGSDIVHTNIDCAAKKGMPPTGVWLNRYGVIEEFVTPRKVASVE